MERKALGSLIGADAVGAGYFPVSPLSDRLSETSSRLDERRTKIPSRPRNRFRIFRWLVSPMQGGYWGFRCAFGIQACRV